MSTQKIHLEGLLGKKLGMTRVFAEDGTAIPVTVIELGPNYVLEVKNKEKHGYSAVKVGFEPKKAQRVSKPDLGNFQEAGRGAFYHVKEIRCNVEELGWTNPGQEIRLDEIFQDGEFVDITGTSIGKGYAGVVKRYRVAGQPATRGTHEMRRHIGSVGCRKSPGRIFKNKKMPGHMGDEKVTVQNLKVIGVRPEQNILLVKGGIPGAKGGLVVVRRAVKKKLKAAKAA